MTAAISIQNPAVFEKDLMNIVIKHVGDAITGSIQPIKNLLTAEIVNAIQGSPTYGELINGSLYDLLALDSPFATLQEVIRVIIENMQIVATPLRYSGGSTIAGGLDIGILQDGFLDVINIPGTSYSTVNFINIPWLEWLLLYGSSILINGKKLVKTITGVALATSPTDLYISPAYSGTVNDNFLTRAILPLEKNILSIIENEITKRL